MDTIQLKRIADAMEEILRLVKKGHGKYKGGSKMKEIIYKGKKVKVPFEDANYTLDGDKDVTLENRFGGEKCTVPGYAAAVYDVIIGAEATKRYDLVQKGCDWFSRNFPKQYMVLLD